MGGQAMTPHETAQHLYEIEQIKQTKARYLRCRHSRSERRSVRGRCQTGEGSPPAPVPVLCAPDRDRGVPRVPAAPRHVWALSPGGVLAPSARLATDHESFLQGV